MADLAVLRIPVDGEWEANEWAEFFNAVDSIYSKLAILEIAEPLVIRVTVPPSEGTQLSRAAGLMALVTDPTRSSGTFLREDRFDFERQMGIDIPPVLRVIGLQYGSTGVADFLGHGKIVESICGSFNKLVDTFSGRKGRKITNAIDQMKLIDALVEQFRKTGATKEQLDQYRLALLQDSDPVLRKLIKKGKLPGKAQILLPPPWYPALPPPAAIKP